MVNNGLTVKLYTNINDYLNAKRNEEVTGTSIKLADTDVCLNVPIHHIAKYEDWTYTGKGTFTLMTFHK